MYKYLVSEVPQSKKLHNNIFATKVRRCNFLYSWTTGFDLCR